MFQNTIVEQEASKNVKHLDLTQGRSLGNFFLQGMIEVEWKAVQASLRTTTDLRVRNGSKAELEEMRMNNQPMQDRLEILSSLEAQRYGPVQLLHEIAKATPDKLQLLELEADHTSSAFTRCNY